MKMNESLEAQLTRFFDRMVEAAKNEDERQGTTDALAITREALQLLGKFLDDLNRKVEELQDVI